MEIKEDSIQCKILIIVSEEPSAKELVTEHLFQNFMIKILEK